MAATHATGKLARQWVRHTRQYVLPFRHTTCFPSLERHGQRGKTCASPEWVIMLIGVLAVQCRAPTDVGIHRMTCRFWKDLCGRQLREAPSSESPWRERFKTIGDQLGTAPGSVVQLCPPEYFVDGGQRRSEEAQRVGAGLASQAKRAGPYPRRTAGLGQGRHVGPTSP
jgi:hypothetical protein